MADSFQTWAKVVKNVSSVFSRVVCMNISIEMSIKYRSLSLVRWVVFVCIVDLSDFE